LWAAFYQTTELFPPGFCALLGEGESPMIRIEGIPVVASRLSKELNPLKGRTNVRRKPGAVAIGKALIVGIRAALQTTKMAA